MNVLFDQDVALQQLLAQLGVPAAIEITDGEGRVRRAAVGLPAIAPQNTASVTKQVTAAVVAMAIAEGAMTEQTSLRSLLPQLPGWAAGVTVQHLVHHTAGLPSTGELLTVVGGTEVELDNRRVVDGLAAIEEPGTAPGTAFRYSNFGYVLLAEMLEQALAAPLPRLARRMLFQPIGIDSARWTAPAGEAHPGRADAVPRTARDGGLWITAHDLRIWLEALNRHRLQPDISDLINTPGALDDGTPDPYAWGATRRPHPTGTRYTHGGGWPGWTAKTLRQPRTGIAVALLTRGADPATVTAMVDHLADRLVAHRDTGPAL